MPIDALCDYVPTRTSIQALVLLFRMTTTEVICDTGNVKVFCCMVQPNVNIRRIDMSRMIDMIDMKALTNAIMMDVKCNYDGCQQGNRNNSKHGCEVFVPSIQVLC
jgi:hypothetical protein